MERLKRIKENLVNCVESQINGNMQEVNTKELGEAIDMIKDMSEAIYYCNVSKAMEEREEEEKYSRKYYMESKEMHHGKEKQIEELERYLKELSEDITEMISGATTEEKTILKQKLAQLTNKIA